MCNNRRALGTPKGSCGTRGADAVHVALKAALAAKGLATTEVRACTSSCQDVCWAGPVVHISPDDIFYGRVTLEDVPEIVAALAEGRVVERLLLPKEDFDAATAAPALPEEPGPVAT